MKGLKIHYFDVKGGPSDAEFHADSEYDGPRALGPQKVGVLNVQS